MDNNNYGPLKKDALSGDVANIKNEDVNRSDMCTFQFLQFVGLLKDHHALKDSINSFSDLAPFKTDKNFISKFDVLPEEIREIEREIFCEGLTSHAMQNYTSCLINCARALEVIVEQICIKLKIDTSKEERPKNCTECETCIIYDKYNPGLSNQLAKIKEVSQDINYPENVITIIKKMTQKAKHPPKKFTNNDSTAIINYILYLLDYLNNIK